jgi:predicted secreted protein
MDFEVRISGQTVAATRSDRVVIRLAENPTTEYRWTFVILEDPLRLDSVEYVPDDVARPGAGGERLITLRATAAGRARVSLALKRAWEPEPTTRFDCDVVIEEH